VSLKLTAAVLFLDLGTNTGWALDVPGRPRASGSEVFKPSRYEGGGMRFLRFREWLGEIAGLASGGLRLGAIFFEEVRRHRGVDAAHVYGGFLAELTAFCEANGIPYQGIPVGTIKRHATGNGNAGKPAMMDAASEMVGRPITNDNEADALCGLDAVINGAHLWKK
jgi:hypothetical protein